MSTHSFHITIGAAPHVRYGEGIKLDREVQLIKAALLYADEATLCSPASTLLIGMAALGEHAVGNLNTRKQLDLLQQIGEALPDGHVFAQVAAMYDVLRRQRGGGAAAIVAKKKIERVVSQGWEQVRAKIFEIAEGAGAAEILSAVEAGRLHLNPLGLDQPNADGSLDELTWAYTDALYDAIKDAVTYPLLDDDTGRLIRALIREGHLTADPQHDARGKQVGLAAALFERLPQFDLATVDEVLDVRRELDQHLTRFRAAVARYADAIGSAVWDESFVADAEQVFVREVAPAVRDIEDAIASTPYLRTLISRFADRGSALSAPILSIAVTQATALPDLLGLAFGGLSVGANLYTAHQDWREKRRQVEGNHLFFYYAAGKELNRLE
ncbi:MAG: hypothetical protein ACK41D_07195 [Rubricoccaceae bacterium]